MGTRLVLPNGEFNKTINNIPDWIDNTNFDDIPVKQAPEFTLTASTNNNVERINVTDNFSILGTNKNNNILCANAKAKLTSFLGRKRCNINDTTVLDNQIIITATIADCPFKYKFTYDIDQGYIKQANTFLAGLDGAFNEYAFSNAGLTDALNDSQNIDKKASIKVEQVNAPISKMSRIEIIRRCGNKLRVAQERIDNNIKEGNIIVVGPNEYASIYDMQKLFPDLNDIPELEESHAADFVDNKVATKITECKSDERLQTEAFIVLNSVFDVYKISNAMREDDNFFVNAEINNHNIREKIACHFKLDKENIKQLVSIDLEDGQKMSVAQALSYFKYAEKAAKCLNNENEKIAGGYVYSMKNIHNVLGSFVDVKDVYTMVNDLCNKNYATKINTSTIASKYSLNELLRFADAKLLDDEDIKRIRADKAYFGQGQKFYSYIVKDNENRQLKAGLSVANAKAQLVKMLPNDIMCLGCDSIDVQDKNVTFITRCFSKTAGVARNLKMVMDRDNTKLSNIKLYVGDKEISIQDAFKTTFIVTTLANIRNNMVGDFIISRQQLKTTLNELVDKDNIDDIIDSWCNLNLIEPIDDNRFAGKISLNNLLETSNICTYDEDTINKIKSAKQYFGDAQDFERVNIQDNDTRSHAANMANNKNFELTKTIADKYFKCADVQKLDNDNFVINIVSDDVTKKIIAKLHNNRIVCKIKDNFIDIAHVADAFAKNDLLKAYLNDNADSEDKSVFTYNQLMKRLADLLDIDTINRSIDELIKTGKLKSIGSKLYACDNFNELLNSLSVAPDDNNKKRRLSAADRQEQYTFDAVYENDTDNRPIIDELGSSDVTNQIITLIPDNIQCKQCTDVIIDNDKFRLQLDYFNTESQISNTITVIGDIVDGHLTNIQYMKNGEIVDINNLDQLNTASKNFNKFIGNNNVQFDIIFDKSSLVNKLKNIIDTNNIDDVLDNWVTLGKIKQLANNKFGSDKSLTELINESNLKSYTDEQIKKNLYKTKLSDTMIPKKYHTKDFGSKMLNQIDNNLSDDKFNEVKSKFAEQIKCAFNKKMITKSKMNNMLSILDTVTNNKDLAAQQADLQRYFN